MVPLLIYEALPVTYMLIGAGLMVSSDLPLLLFSANIFYFVGSTIWIMRSAHRRTDKLKAVHKPWLWPDLVYEYKPFLQILIGTILFRIPLGGVTLIGGLFVVIAVRHLLQRQANRKCVSHLFA